MKICIFLIGVLVNASSLASTFFLSEIYARHIGRDHKGKQWLEVELNQPIILTNVQIDTYDNQRNLQQSFQTKLAAPLSTTSHLVIAATRDLGLPYCLNHDNVLITPTLQFDYRKTKRICVTLNQDRACTELDLTLSKPGVGLYRDTSATSLWRHEPCHLADAIFATPGKPARYCTALLPESGTPLVDHCPLKPFFGKRLNFKKILASTNHAPVITHAQITKNKNAIHVTTSFTDPDQGPWIATICHAHRETHKICHVVGARHQVFPNIENNVPVTKIALPPNHYISIEIADVTGAQARTVVANADDDPIFVPKEWAPSLKRRFQADGSDQLHLTLTAEDVPFNLLLQTDSMKFYQRAFVQTGSFLIDLPQSVWGGVISASLSGPQGLRFMRLN